MHALPYTFFIEVKFIKHKINHFKVHNSVAFRTSMVLCNDPLST